MIAIPSNDATPVRRLRAARTSAAAIALAAALGLVAATPATAATTAGSGFAQGGGDAVGDFYRSRGGAPLWLAPSAGNAAPLLLQILGSARADNLNPKRYPVRNLARALQAASTGNPAAVRGAEMMLSQAFVAYARDLRHDPQVGITSAASGSPCPRRPHASRPTSDRSPWHDRTSRTGSHNPWL